VVRHGEVGEPFRDDVFYSIVPAVDQQVPGGIGDSKILQELLAVRPKVDRDSKLAAHEVFKRWRVAATQPQCAAFYADTIQGACRRTEWRRPTA
jgi:hypothetical protein